MADFNTIHSTLKNMPVPGAAQRAKLIQAIDSKPSKPQPSIEQRLARATAPKQPQSANSILTKQRSYGG